MSDTDSEDLPFVEKYRPKNLSEVISHENIVSTLRSYLDNDIGRIPHLLFYGPPGTGKTSVIEAFVSELYGEENKSYMVMVINASEERGIDVVRDKIRNFVNNKGLCIDNGSPQYKFVILDEADAVTAEAQGMLRIVIEKSVDNARFCLICNSLNKINNAIQSRCQRFKFKPLDYDSVISKMDYIAKSIGVSITATGKKTIWKLSGGDMRHVMHMLQVISINNKKINEKVVTRFQRYPTNKEMDILFDNMVKINDVGELYVLANNEINKGYVLRDIMKEMFTRITDNIDMFTKEQSINIYTQLRDIEINILQTGNTKTQLGAFISIFAFTL